MDADEATRIVFSRIQGLDDPENVAKVMSFLLSQDHGDKEMIRLAFATEALLQSVVVKARKELGLLPSLSSLSSAVRLPPQMMLLSPPSSPRRALLLFLYLLLRASSTVLSALPPRWLRPPSFPTPTMSVSPLLSARIAINFTRTFRILPEPEQKPISQDHRDDEIEEGQLTEESDDRDIGFLTKDQTPKEDIRCSLAKPCFSAKVRNKNTQSHESITNNNTVEGYDNEHIMEILAKTEKRRKRFIKPIAPDKLKLRVCYISRMGTTVTSPMGSPITLLPLVRWLRPLRNTARPCSSSRMKAEEVSGQPSILFHSPSTLSADAKNQLLVHFDKGSPGMANEIKEVLEGSNVEAKIDAFKKAIMLQQGISKELQLSSLSSTIV
ncbi:hypothetical protein Cni_G13510 [Canna indica]|uniref:AtC3H46-like PABC-like domain-containing protein n=1 Tax=Canna indica TaxID=4628 RepID=A0AAQ3K9N6_9LILI|nr:hypothetical protein Cni_G13510 [Canna indica]